METGQQGIFIKKSWVSFLLVFCGVQMVIMSFGMIPKEEEMIMSLNREIQDLEKALENALFGKGEAEQKIEVLEDRIKALESENYCLNSFYPLSYNPGLPAREIEKQKKLTRQDSVCIGEAMKYQILNSADSLEIYYQVEEREVKKMTGGFRPMNK